MKQDKMDEQGFILLDVCLAIVIFLATLALLLGTEIIAREQVHSNAELTAAFLANEQLASVAGKGRDFLQSTNGCDWLGGGTSTIQQNGQSFQMETRINNADENAALKQVTVDISWQEGEKRMKRQYEKIIYLDNLQP